MISLFNGSSVSLLSTNAPCQLLQLPSAVRALKAEVYPKKTQYCWVLASVFSTFHHFWKSPWIIFFLLIITRREIFCRTTLKGLAQCNLFNYKAKLNKLSRWWCPRQSTAQCTQAQLHRHSGVATTFLCHWHRQTGWIHRGNESAA